MPDISTFWPPGGAAGDWLLVGPDLASGSDLETAVLISLFTDRRADEDDVIPDRNGDRRGWWGDLGASKPIGSKLWLLEREKQTEATRLAAEDHCREALNWLVEDGIAVDVEVSASWQRGGFLGVQIVIAQPSGEDVNLAYQFAWKAVH